MSGQQRPRNDGKRANRVHGMLRECGCEHACERTIRFQAGSDGWFVYQSKDALH